MSDLGTMARKMVMPAIEERSKHESCALLAHHRAVDASKRYERICRDIEELLRDPIAESVTGYVDFRMWEAQVDRWTAQNPSSFDREVFDAVREIDSLYRTTFRIWIDVLDQIDRDGIEVHVPSADALRRHYSEMASIDLMDHGPLPEHIADLAANAKKAFELGEVEEIGEGD